MKEKNILFICTPNLGILDNWLPILWHLKEKRPDNSFVFVVPKSRDIDEIDEANILFILSKGIFDRIVFRSWFGGWLLANSFTEAKQLNRRNFFNNIIYKIIKTLIGKDFKATVLSLITKGYFHLNIYKKNYWNLQEEAKKTDCVLYDVFVHGKPYTYDLMRALTNVKKYSLSHGVELRIKINAESNYKISNEDIKYITAYLYSEHEREYYNTTYGLPGSNLRIVGVPRHSLSWINFILKHETSISEKIGEGFIFVISRPGTSEYFSRERKRKALADIKRLAWDDLNKKIVVKLHPKEKMEGLYEEVFGKSSYGEKWHYSNAHPFILGQKCTFAISFFSGVPVDLIVLDVPTIELLDLRGIPEFDNKDALRDQKGNPVFMYRYYGLVLGANDYEDLKFQAERLIKDRPIIQKELRDKYCELFTKIQDADILVADEIANS